MAVCVKYASGFEMSMKIICLFGIVTVLVVFVNVEAEVTDTNYKIDNVRSRHDGSRQENDSKHSFKTYLKQSQTSEPISDDTDTNELNSEPDTSDDVWSIVYSSVKNVFDDCNQEKIDYTPKHNERDIFKCLKNSAIRELNPVVEGSKVSVLEGLLEFRKDDGGNLTEGYRVPRKEKVVEQLEVPLDYMKDFDKLTRKISVRVKLMPGLFLRFARRDDGLRMGLELDERDFSRMEGRGENRKKLKKLKRFLPLLLIPVALQFILLPMILTSLKMMATKALLAGKLALLLVLFNAVYGAMVPQHDEHNTRVAGDHYGYDGGVEYGAFVNRRYERDRGMKHDLPFRGQR